MQRTSGALVEEPHRLNVRGIAAPVEVRRHPAARRLTLRVSRTRRAVIVTVPMQCNLDEADRFVHRYVGWVQERLGDLPQPIGFLAGTEVPLRGVRHVIRHAGPARGGEVVQPVAGAPPELHVAGQPEHAARRLKDWLLAQARKDLDERVGWHARTLQLRPRRIVIRDQATRWGSCSSTGVLSFSWRLILAPAHILDYVAAHEVAHLAEMNHGPRFWELVEMTYPRVKEARHWLRHHGIELHRYGADTGEATERSAA